ncbi:heme biosynthesis protein HemY [Wolbachia endosymbiont of Chironomus riparius]|uniref:heme biosynthesis protein HemY n=1 Tax=Wolbachia endosymbiont of Chironomus riparius TaxID=2883238 RepID=UPI0020A16C96|nr:heme biosynthesis protein HemY [Wolbachia endosymbiont of Chironomus riparius]
MIYLVTFIIAFFFGLWVKVSGEILKLELGNYAISIDLYFIILVFVFLLFLLIIFVRFFSSIASTLVNIRSKKKDRDLALIFEAFFSLDLNDTENFQKLVKNLNQENDKLLLIKTFHAGKTGDYNFFSHNIISIASKNHNLALLLSSKLIVQLKKDKISFQKFIEYCSNSITDKVLSLPFQIENSIIRHDWHNAILKLNESKRLNVSLSFSQKKMLAALYCALAREYESKGDLKQAIKSVFIAQSNYAAFQPINYLKAEFYTKLGKIRKASAVLEEEYELNPTPQIAKLYISLNNQNAEKLYNLRSDYYFSYCVLALFAIDSGKYDLADQYLNTAMKQVNYLSTYLIMVKLKVLLQEYDEAIYWLNQLHSQALSDPGWRCKNCNKELKQWDFICSYCSEFNCIELV